MDTNEETMTRGSVKKLKFAHHLVGKVLDGTKTATWRLFDDKELATGDLLAFIDRDTGEQFAEAEIVSLKEKKLGDIDESDFSGHERYENEAEMLETYRGYYGDTVRLDTIVKIVHFKLLKRDKI